mgnify:FL=1
MEIDVDGSAIKPLIVIHQVFKMSHVSKSEFSASLQVCHMCYNKCVNIKHRSIEPDFVNAGRSSIRQNCEYLQRLSELRWQNEFSFKESEHKKRYK